MDCLHDICRVAAASPPPRLPVVNASRICSARARDPRCFHLSVQHILATDSIYSCASATHSMSGCRFVEVCVNREPAGEL